MSIVQCQKNYIPQLIKLCHFEVIYSSIVMLSALYINAANLAANQEQRGTHHVFLGKHPGIVYVH